MFADIDLSHYDRLRVTSATGQLIATGRTIRRG